MVSADLKITAKPGEKRIVQQVETITESTLQHLSSVEFAIAALRKQGCSGAIELLSYSSVVRMVESLRHGNPACQRTVTTYIVALSQISRILRMNPDEIIESNKNAGEDEIQGLFLRLDQRWIEEANSPSTRRTKLAALIKFLYENGVRRVRLVKPGIRKYPTRKDYALTTDDCKRVLETCRNTQEKLLVAILMESLQRIGTINSLTWGDVTQHLEKGDDTFLIMIDSARTKRNIEHWMPIGRLSIYYLEKRLAELRSRGIEPTADTPIFTSEATAQLKPVKSHYLTQKIHRLLMKLGIAGQKQGNKEGTRYEKRCHDFRKFGVVEMQKCKVNEEIIRYLMGQKRDTYSSWDNRYDELLTIYRDAMPRLEQRNAIQEVVDFARSRGYSLDPKSLTFMCQGRDIRDSGGPGDKSCGVAEA